MGFLRLTCVALGALQALAAPTSAGHHAAAVAPGADAGYNSFQHAYDGPQIVFSIVTSQSHHEDRAKAQLETWCAEIHACVFFSDAVNPSNDPATVQVELQKMGFEEEKIEHTRKDQLRFLGALAKTRELVTDKSKHDTFGSVKWIVLCDDESFFFYHNLLKHLDQMDHNKAIYTGSVVPGSEDEQGNGIVHIGGGAVFSKAALIQMKNIPDCIQKTNLHKPWGTWQSDAIVGECAYEAGIPSTPTHMGVFNQIGCTNTEGKAVHYCGKPTTELYDGLSYAKGEFSTIGFASDDATERYSHDSGCNCAAHYDQPASLHPVYESDSMKMLYTTFAESSSTNATNVTVAKTKGTKIETMTPEEKKWYDEGYTYGFNKGKAHGEKTGERWEREARITGEKDGEHRGKLQGEKIGERAGERDGIKRGYDMGERAMSKVGEVRESKQLKKVDSHAEHAEGVENRKAYREASGTAKSGQQSGQQSTGSGSGSGSGGSQSSSGQQSSSSGSSSSGSSSSGSSTGSSSSGSSSSKSDGDVPSPA